MEVLKTVLLVGCLTVFGSTSMATSAPIKCIDLFASHVQDGHDSRPRSLSSESLWKILNEKKINGADVIQILSQEPTLKGLFEASAGVREGYSIAEHTRMVFDIFAEQYHLYSAYYHFQVHSDVRLFQTLKFAIALHDIGKPYAIAAGDKNRQHEFTVPILDRAFAEFGFSEHESKLAHALVGNDIMGELVKGVIDVQTAKAKLSQVAMQAQMPVMDFVPLQFLFYASDAASYPTLRRRIFSTTPEGLLIPNRGQFENLWALITNP